MDANCVACRISRFAARLFATEEEEATRALIAFVCFFCILSSFYLLLPLRDELGLRIGTAWLPSLFVASLVATTAAAPLTSSYFCRKTHGKTQRLSRFYLFIAVVVSGFILAFTLLPSRSQIQSPSSKHPLDWSLSQVEVSVYSCFYVWVGVQNAICISSLWARCADIFPRNTAEKLFGCIGAGSTFGQLFGSAMARYLLLEQSSDTLQYRLLVASTLCMAAASWFVNKLPHDTSDKLTPDKATISVELLDGFRLIVKSRHLRLMGLYVMMSYAVATQFYFEKISIAESALESSKLRASWFATLNLYSGIVIAVLQLAVTGRILTGLPLSYVLFLTPAVCASGMLSVTVHAAPSAIGAAEVARKIFTFALGRPARETLFTVLNSEEKYKAKLIIDAVFQRVGDVFGAALFHGLHSTIALTPKDIAAFAALLSLLWGIIGISLAKRHQKIIG